MKFRSSSEILPSDASPLDNHISKLESKDPNQFIKMTLHVLDFQMTPVENN